MLKSCLLHPEILEALGRAGHSSKILIADGNYPFATQLGPNARLVSLNLSPGLVNIPRCSKRSLAWSLSRRRRSWSLVPGAYRRMSNPPRESLHRLSPAASIVLLLLAQAGRT